MSTLAGPAALLATPAPGPRLSIDEFLARHAGTPGAELLQGVVKEPPMPWPKHGMIGLHIGSLIFQHATLHDLGRVASNDSFVQTGPDTVRGGDVCFWSYERLPRGPVPKGLLPVAPDLVVEVKSASETWTDLFGKVVEYLKAGVRVVVLLDPESATASVYHPDELQRTLHNGDELSLPDVLPGFAVPVNRLFA
jgi:Uma2 family endonuclease